MNEIKLHVNNENLETILTLLDNLKPGLISDIQINKTRSTQYKPKTKTIIREEESGANDTSGKYLNPAAYKQRLNKR